MIYANCHRHHVRVVTFGRSLFKVVYLEFEKNPYSYMLSMRDKSFYRLCFSKNISPSLQVVFSIVDRSQFEI
jgi:hypothetical protein